MDKLLVEVKEAHDIMMGGEYLGSEYELRERAHSRAQAPVASCQLQSMEKRVCCRFLHCRTKAKPQHNIPVRPQSPPRTCPLPLARYRAFVESKSNTTIDQMVKEFLDLDNTKDRSKIYLFNLHHRNRQGWQFEKSLLNNSVDSNFRAVCQKLEAVKTNQRCTYEFLKPGGDVKGSYTSILSFSYMLLHCGSVGDETILSPTFLSPTYWKDLTISQASISHDSCFRTISIETWVVQRRASEQDPGAPPPY